MARFGRVMLRIVGAELVLVFAPPVVMSLGSPTGAAMGVWVVVGVVLWVWAHRLSARRVRA